MITKRIGAFICECGDRIASALDVGEIAERLAQSGGLETVEVLPYACSPEGLGAIGCRCSAENLAGVVIAGCSPRVMEGHFRRAFGSRGFHDLHVEVANIRECSACAHGEDSAAANQKAIDMVRMAAAKLGAQRTRDPVERQVSQQVLVVGGGVAGITAALTLAAGGVPVKLVERDGDIGISQGGPWECALPEPVVAGLRARASQVQEHALIELFLGAQV